MSRLSTALHNDIKLLHFAHDELALQSHLLGAELKQRWQELETQWQELKERTGRVEVAGDAAVREVETAAKLLIDSLKKGFADLKRTLAP